MLQERDAPNFAETSDVEALGDTTIVASMLVFVFMTVIMWSLAGYQIYRGLKLRRLALKGQWPRQVDARGPQDDLPIGTRASAQPSRRDSWENDDPATSEEKPVRKFLRRIGELAMTLKPSTETITQAVSELR
ncbi:hypothetical protein F4802DRAFT_602715 [Xylaria palmicola]|nr:hypothetical protein F4802DRAFT_602715 [Xylaria palmicola]